MAKAKQPKAAPQAAAQQQQTPAPAPASATVPPWAPQPAQPAPAAPAQPATVALRGGPAVQYVALTGKAYRTAAPHNVAWWQTITAGIAAGNGALAVATVVATQANPKGVPAAFVGYALRRGYLQAVAQPPQAPAPAGTPAAAAATTQP